ncbi:hypothetical protein OBBRIDRAFT_835917 [Obba rivulosa]|uniref:Uncharacterized protein n=1 Tax=Obba rivulosa TaxID=1052685 RepID=A0A8E2AQW6_9APHY|nr:hypothetical protein OBBRIDRAFT_835917 [Obba rivulosa]
MSSPVPIPRASSATAAPSSSASPSGLYIPIHKRTPSAASPARPESPPRKAQAHHEPSRSWAHARPCRSPTPRPPAPAATASSRSSPAPIPAPKIPVSKRPNTYSISDLLSLSRSPLVGLSPAQLAHVAALVPAMLPAAPKPGEQPARRRRAGRKVKNAKMLAQAAIGTDVESRRRRHGAGGWQGELHPAAPVREPSNALQDSWRVARTLEVHA